MTRSSREPLCHSRSISAKAWAGLAPLDQFGGDYAQGGEGHAVALTHAWDKASRASSLLLAAQRVQQVVQSRVEGLWLTHMLQQPGHLGADQVLVYFSHVLPPLCFCQTKKYPFDNRKMTHLGCLA